MNLSKVILYTTLMLLCAKLWCQEYQNSFDINHDLILANYDCKTDVDDLHSVAAFATLIRQAEYKNLKLSLIHI